MPLLKKQPFIRKEISKDLKENDEVFFCALTKEVFTEYEEFFERIIVCNSLVWTCSISGRFGLTYQEALESEEKALKCLESFPESLQKPILYIASLTQRSTLNDMCDDVFLFARDRYFLGENVQVTSGSTKKMCTILKVVPPTKEEIQKNSKNAYISNPKETNDKTSHPHAHLYRYLIKESNMPNSKGQVVKAHNIIRPKGMFTRVKNKLFLKQHTTLNNKIRVVKNEFVKKYGLDVINFGNIFANEVPGFSQTSNKKGLANEDGEISSNVKSSSRSMILVSHEHNDSPKNASSDEDPEIQKVLDAERRKQEREQEKEKKKEEQRLKAEHAKAWNKPRDDLECDDLKPLPKGDTIPTQLNANCFGDALTVLEFVNTFGDLLDAKENFPNGLTFAQVERGILGKERNGTYLELLQFLLASIFHLQSGEEHSNEFHEDAEEMIEELKNQSEAVRKATMASGLASTLYGQPLRELAVESTNVTEILRLHLLGSGGLAHAKNALYRYQQRGAYGPRDDPGLELKLAHPEIMVELECKTVFELGPDHKARLLCTLINQLLTFVTLREFVEDNLEKVRLTKMDMRSSQTSSAATNTNTNANPQTQGPKEEPAPASELSQKLEAFQRRGATMALGRDRAFRRYWLVEGVAGLYAEDFEANPGSCMDEATPLPTPKKEHKKWFGLDRSQCDSSHDSLELVVRDVVDALLDRISDNDCTVKKEILDYDNRITVLTCNARSSTCALHSSIKVAERRQLASTPTQAGSGPEARPFWTVYSSPEQYTALLNAFNKRGHRERHLRNVLLGKKLKILQSMTAYRDACSAGYFSAAGPDHESLRQLDPNADLLELADTLLDLEDRIFVSGLGRVAVQNRSRWRSSLENADFLNNIFQEGLQMVEPSAPEENTTISSHVARELHAIGKALVQIGRGVDTRFLQEPLGEDETTKQTRLKSLLDANFRNGENGLGSSAGNITAAPPTPFYGRWEGNVLTARNTSQLYMHCFTLDHCVTWSKSLLKVRCKICRKKNYPEQLLLCDGCNKGHHTFCVKPKIKKIPEGDWFCPSCSKTLMPHAILKPQADAARAKFAGAKVINDDAMMEEEINDLPNPMMLLKSEPGSENEDLGSNIFTLIEGGGAFAGNNGTVACLEDNSDASSVASATTRGYNDSPAIDERIVPLMLSNQRKNTGREGRKSVITFATTPVGGHKQRSLPNACIVCGGEQDLSLCICCQDALIHHPQCSVTLEAGNIDRDSFTCPSCIQGHNNPNPFLPLQNDPSVKVEAARSSSTDDAIRQPESCDRPGRGRGSRGGSRGRGRSSGGGGSRGRGGVLLAASPLAEDPPSADKTTRSGRRVKPSTRYENDLDPTNQIIGLEPIGSEEPKTVLALGPGAKRKRSDQPIATSPNRRSYDVDSDEGESPIVIHRPLGVRTRGRGHPGKRIVNGHAPYAPQNNLLTSPPPPFEGTEADAAVKTYSRSFENSFNREQKIREEIVQNLKKHADSWPFLKPVSKVKVPDYYTIVKKPIDLGTVKAKVDDLKYPDMRSFVEDVKLIFHNCWLYNHDSTLEYKAAQSLEIFFKKRLSDFNLGTTYHELADKSDSEEIIHKYPLVSLSQQSLTNGIREPLVLHSKTIL